MNDARLHWLCGAAASNARKYLLERGVEAFAVNIVVVLSDRTTHTSGGAVNIAPHDLAELLRESADRLDAGRVTDLNDSDLNGKDGAK